MLTVGMKNDTYDQKYTKCTVIPAKAGIYNRDRLSGIGCGKHGI
jgi:hypothetical protein